MNRCDVCETKLIHIKIVADESTKSNSVIGSSYKLG